ncbi:MAG: helix-turn-helix domain-containing protein [Acutalibacteraceae bacterium]
MFAKSLKTIMNETKITASELSELTGISKSSISQYLSGSTKPRIGAVRKIAAALHVTVERLGIEVKNISVAQAADLMGVSQQYIRIGLQRGRLPFGTAVQISNKKWTYHISPAKFAEYTGIKV